MKILHTSDWHLGHKLYDFDRHEEAVHTLRAIRKIVEEESPDLFLLCGDIFDSTKPSFRTQQLFFNFLDELRADWPNMDIVVIAGNHDSASLHDVFSQPWKSLNITVIGISGRTLDDAMGNVLTIPGKCVVAPLPYFVTRGSEEEYIAGFISKVLDTAEPGVPVIAALHTTVTNADYTGHDIRREGYIGGIKAVSSKAFAGVDYVALGHIHRLQTIAGNIRYSGSPMPVSFDENYPHSVSIVEFVEGRTSIKALEIEPLIPLCTLPEPGCYLPMAQALAELEALPDNEEVYIRLNVSNNNPIAPSDVDRAYSICKDKRARLCTINRQLSQSPLAGSEKYLELSEFKEMEPVEVARKFATDASLSLPDEYFEMMQSVIDELDQERRVE